MVNKKLLILAAILFMLLMLYAFNKNQSGTDQFLVTSPSPTIDFVTSPSPTIDVGRQMKLDRIKEIDNIIHRLTTLLDIQIKAEEDCINKYGAVVCSDTYKKGIDDTAKDIDKYENQKAIILSGL